MVPAQEKSDPTSQPAPRLPEPGYVIYPDVPAAPALVDAVQHDLMKLGFLQSPVPLDYLHHHLPEEAMTLNEHYTNAVSRALYTLSERILDAYRELIAHVAGHVLHDDFLFQERPIIRFHFPVAFPDSMKNVEGRPRQLHSDLLGGHPRHMVQGWLALTDCAGSAALQCSPRDDGVALLGRYRAMLGPDDPPFAESLQRFYDAWDRDPGFGEALTAACKPVAMRAGDLLLFDPHCIHGGTENREDTTRVSLDFRLLPVAQEAVALSEATTETGRRFRRGELFCARSARQLFG